MFWKSKKAASSQSDDWNDEWNLDQFWMAQELEFQHQNQGIQFRAGETNPLQLGRIVNTLFDIRKEEVAMLTVNDGTSLTKIERQDEIWNYNIMTVIMQQCETSYAQQFVIMSLFYRGYDQKDLDKDKSISKRDACLIIHLTNGGGIRKKVLYVQATFCLPPIRLERLKGGMFSQAKNISFLIGYDYLPADELSKEFDVVFKSAIDKVKNHKVKELSYLENVLLDLFTYPHVAQDFYMGKQVMQYNRFWDAIAYFESAFKALQLKQWQGEKLSDDEHAKLLELSFLIGFCYYELRLFDKAYKYLEYSYRFNPLNYDYFTEYVNCLERLHDIRAWHIIADRLDKINKENPSKEESDIILFCLRRRAYMLIELKDYENAKRDLDIILKIKPDNEFALNELKYINMISKSE
ncbi:MAG: hypothetical protein LBR18_07520 [Tannerella sp.]|jgi:tetratricopeptide (TPR) repeat protein|nr:hypothetical protein [Tannerella sp.]